MEKQFLDSESCFTWTIHDGTVYGKIVPAVRYSDFTFRFSYYNGWIDGVDVYDTSKPSEGWISVITCQHVESGAVNYFNPFVDNKCNNDGAVALLKRQLDFIYFGRMPVGV